MISRNGNAGSVPAPVEPAKPAAFRDIGVRALSALVLAPLGLGAVYLGGTVWDVTLAVIAVGLAAEWVWLTGTGLPLPLLVPWLLYMTHRVDAPLMPILMLGGVLLAWVFPPRWTPALPRATPVGQQRLISVLGLLYIGTGVVTLAYVRHAGAGAVMALLLLVWGADIGAYLAGRLIGGPKLAPRISPGKTWSGAVAGLVAGTVIGGLCARYAVPSISCSEAACGAAMLTLASQAGDLFESAIKRRYGKKDSSRLIPGHGGLLDRLDAVLGAACVLGVGALLW